MTQVHHSCNCCSAKHSLNFTSHQNANSPGHEFLSMNIDNFASPPSFTINDHQETQLTFSVSVKSLRDNGVIFKGPYSDTFKLVQFLKAWMYDPTGSVNAYNCGPHHLYLEYEKSISELSLAKSVKYFKLKFDASSLAKVAHMENVNAVMTITCIFKH